MRRLAAVLMVPVVLGGGGARAQQTTAIEVASIKRNDSGNQGNRFVRPEPGGRVTVINMPVFPLLWMAHGVQAYQIVDAPDWTRGEAYDILARGPEGTTTSPDTFRALLRELLVNRFQLKVRRESRELPIVALVRVRQDGPLGPKLRPSKVDCMAMLAGNKSVAPSQGGPNCGANTLTGRFTSNGLPLGPFISLLAPVVGRVVVDRTGLTGSWDLDVEFTPEPVGGAAGVPVPPAAPVSADAPSLVTALEEQLGLKLESTRGPVDVIVIESISRPTEN